MAPKRPVTVSTIAATLARSVTSTPTATAWAPPATSSAATVSARARSASATATAPPAPAIPRAMALPSPPPPPVTTTTRPVRWKPAYRGITAASPVGRRAGGGFRALEPAKQLGQPDLGQGVDDEVGVRQGEGPGERVQGGHAAHPGRAGGTDPVGRVLEHDTPLRGDAEARGGEQEEIRRRLHALDVVPRHHRLDPPPNAVVLEPALDPARGAARRDGPPEPERLTLGEERLDTGEKGLLEAA